MAKVALLIGVSEYGSGLNPLPGAVKAVEAMQQVLPRLGRDSFDEVKRLVNPNPPVMREAIETLFSDRAKDDVVLLFFSGHIVRDDRANLYLATSIARQCLRTELLRISCVPASLVGDLMSNSLCQQQVIILDGCFSPVPARKIAADDSSAADIKTQLGGKGRTILTSFTSPENSTDLERADCSVYTRYLAEGIRTGAADLDSDGWISVDELHDYASNKVRTAAPAVKLGCDSVENGKILLFATRIDDPKLKYRQEVESWVSQGEISPAGRYILDKLAKTSQLTSEECAVIEAEVLQPYREYREKLQRYELEFAQAIDREGSLSTQSREELKSLQQLLGLRDKDVAAIEEQILQLVSNADSEDDTNELVQSNIEGYLNSLSSTPSKVLSASEQTPIVQPTNPPPVVNSSPELVGSQISRPFPTFSNKALLLLSIVGIGGGLATLAFAIGISTRTSVAPPADSVNTESPSSAPSPQPSPATKKPDNQSSPNVMASPPSTREESKGKGCSVRVNGNLRSTPTTFQNNIVNMISELLPVTGKQTIGGWVQVRLSDNRVAWVHRDVISSDSEKEMDACISRKGIPIQTVGDIPPPSRPSPQAGN